MAKQQVVPELPIEPEIEETPVPVLAQPEPVSKVQVLEDYGGRRTGEVRIQPGVYDVDDPALFGLADYLIANGKARKV